MQLLRRREARIVAKDLVDCEHFQPFLGLDLWRLKVVVEVDSQAILTPILLFELSNLLLCVRVAKVHVQAALDREVLLGELGTIAELHIFHVDRFKVQV